MVVFLGLGGALLLEILSIYYSSRTFWIVFCFVSLNKSQHFHKILLQFYILVTSVATIHAYNQGRLKGLRWHRYYWELSKILCEDVKDLLTCVKKEGFLLVQSA